MAQCKQSPQDFIKNAFTPQIAILSSPLAEQHCQKNNLKFIELLQPFSKLGTDLHYKDPTGGVVTLRSLKLTFLDVHARPPQTTLARKLLNSSVSEQSESRVERYSTGGYHLDITSSTPWYESWRDTFLKVQYPSDHEYTKHFLSCVLVVSSGELNVLETATQLAQSLNQMQSYTPGKFPKWFSSNILRYFVIIHDNVEGNLDGANEAYNSLKVSYGETSCFLLRMNSRPMGSANSEHLPDPWSQFINSSIEAKEVNLSPETSPYTSRANVVSDVKSNVYHPLSPDTEDLTLPNSISEEPKSAPTANRLKVHGACLSTEDVEQVKFFIIEYCRACLLPYVEKQIFQLNDLISNKKGVSRSFISATKRWFNPNKPGASAVAVNNLIYAPDSQELQAYHLAKRDYNTDQAWLYYAGAVEMAALAAFMSNESNRKTYDYMEEGITTYLNTCKMPQFATRATLLSSECLKSKGHFGEAAHQLIRMTSEESDLRSALFLEQAAYAFLHSRMVRKYAFHMVLAGHRFSKAAQRRHSLRAYRQAHQAYAGAGWALAEDHIHYTIGRLAHNLHQFNEAVGAFAHLLKGDSKQSGQQQSVFLKEYLTILANKLSNDQDEATPTLALPNLKHDSIRVIMGPTKPLTTPGKVPALGVSFDDQETADATLKWNKLEEILVSEMQGGLTVFKPMIILHTIKQFEKNQPVGIVNEPVQVCIKLGNFLQIILQMKDIYLLWTFESSSGEGATNEETNSNINDNYVKTHITKSVLIQASCNQDVVLSVTPVTTGKIVLKGLCYTLTSSTTPTDSIFIKGKQMFETVPLQIKIVPLAPCLQTPTLINLIERMIKVTFSEIHPDCLCDEVQPVAVDLTNIGTLPLHKIALATSSPALLCNAASLGADAKRRDCSLRGATPAVREKRLRERHVSAAPLPRGGLAPGASAGLTLYLRAPAAAGARAVDLLVYYENGAAAPRYRLVRHRWQLNVQESVRAECAPQGSHGAARVEEVALVLKATNLNRFHSTCTTEVAVASVSLYSRSWNLVENVVTPKNITLGSQESAHVLLKARRVDGASRQLSSVVLAGEAARQRVGRAAYLAFAEKGEDDASVFNFHGREAAEEGADGCLLVRWQAVVNDSGRRVTEGQTQIPVRIHQSVDKAAEIDEFSVVSDPANLLEASLSRDKNAEAAQVEEPKITYNVIFSPIVRHDFKLNRLCIIPVSLLVHSIIDDDTLNVVITTLSANCPLVDTNQTELFCPYASKNFTWVGSASAVKELKPLSTIKVPLSVLITRPGTFDLGSRIEISTNSKTKNDSPVIQICQSQSALIVVDS